MRLYLIRHAHSPSTAESGAANDAERPISDKGRKETAVMAAYIKDTAKAKPVIILTSPLLRARQTSEELAQTLKPSLGIEETELLAGGEPVRSLWENLLRLLEQKKAGEAAVVGHMPQISELVGRFCGQIVDFKPAGTACIEIGRDGKAKLIWYRNP